MAISHVLGGSPDTPASHRHTMPSFNVMGSPCMTPTRTYMPNPMFHIFKLVMSTLFALWLLAVPVLAWIAAEGVGMWAVVILAVAIYAFTGFVVGIPAWIYGSLTCRRP